MSAEKKSFLSTKWIVAIVFVLCLACAGGLLLLYRLFPPLSILKGLYYSRKITGLRLLLLGIRKAYRNRGVDALMLREGFHGIRMKGDKYKRVEFSWILEDNLPVQRLIEMIGGRLYKKYRIYEKAIG